MGDTPLKHPPTIAGLSEGDWYDACRAIARICRLSGRRSAVLELIRPNERINALQLAFGCIIGLSYVEPSSDGFFIIQELRAAIFTVLLDSPVFAVTAVKESFITACRRKTHLHLLQSWGIPEADRTAEIA